MNTITARHVIRLSIILVVLLLSTLQYFDQDRVWIFSIIASGLIVIYFGVSPQTGSTSMLMLGAIITCSGLSLLGQSIIGCWEVWATIWSIHPVATIITIKYAGWRHRNNTLDYIEQQPVILAMILFLFFSIFFDGLTFQDRNFPFSSVLLPLILYLLGRYQLVTQSKNPPIQSSHIDQTTTLNTTLVA